MKKQQKIKKSNLPKVIAGFTALALLATPAIYLATLNSNANALAIWSIAPDSGGVEGGTDIIIKGEFETTANIIQVSGGDSHTLALDSKGTVYSWGSDESGQLGNDEYYGSGQDYYQSTPVSLAKSGDLAGKKIVQISAGNYHSLALDDTGKIYAWGANWDGQIGDGTQQIQPTPVAVDTSGVLNGKNIIQISGGGDHSLALDDTGKVYAWGSDNNGQLGNDIDETDQIIPVAVDTTGVLTNKTISQISAGGNHSLAIDNGGKIYAWGYNWNGQLGDGNSQTTQPTPIAADTTGILADKTISKINAGRYHSLALDNDGKAYAWGNGANGQLGDNTQNDHYSPVAIDTSGVLAGKKLIQVTGGDRHSLALDEEGQLYSWGYNYSGQLGNDSSGDNELLPVRVDMSDTLDGKTIIQNEAGGSHSLALDSTGKIYAWGSDNRGQLGTNSEYVYGSSAHKNSPIAVNTDLGISDLTYTPDTIEVILDPDGTPSACLNVVVVDKNTVTCTTPPHIKGKVDVQIGDGPDAVTLIDGFEYIAGVEVPNTGAGSMGDSASGGAQTSVIVFGSIITLGAIGFTARKQSKKIRLKK